MNRLVEKVQQEQLRKDLQEIRPGDTVRVHVRLKEGEGEKERIQPFEGVVIRRSGRLASETFTVRRVSFGVGIERIFPLHSPVIADIEILQRGRVRRAKLHYLRQRTGKAARLKRAGHLETPATPPEAEALASSAPAGEAKP